MLIGFFTATSFKFSHYKRFLRYCTISQVRKMGQDEMKAILRKEEIFKYNTEIFDFRNLILQIFVEENYLNSLPNNFNMSKLHDLSIGNTSKTDGSGNTINYFQWKWNKERNREQMSSSYIAFNNLYVKFVKEVIGPIMGGGRIIYQRAPSLRVSPPSDIPVGKLHCDLDYHHQPSEINFWLPITSVWDSNTLWVESSPGLGDFHPLNLIYGQCCKFYGNLCRHHTVPNSSNSTRISLDFRVVSELSGGHDPSFHKGVSRGPKARYQRAFDIGGFYSELQSDSIYMSAP